MNVMHSSRSNSWGTPSWLIEKVRLVLGGIDFDPASSRIFNETVLAKDYYTEGALEKQWPPGSIFLNPPGGKIKNKSQTALFWQKLMEHRKYTGFTHGIFLAFSAEALQNTQGKGCLALGDFPLCVPSKRIRFEGHYCKQSPSHSNVIAYVPGSANRVQIFEQVFKDVGTVLNKDILFL